MVTWLKSNGVLRSIYVLIYLHGKMCTMHVRMETLEDMSDDDEDQPAAEAAATAGSQAGFSAQLLIKYWLGCPTLRYHESYIFTILKFSSIIINCYYISPVFTNFRQFSLFLRSRETITTSSRQKLALNLNAEVERGPRK